MSLEKYASSVEQQIATRLIDDALIAGYSISVYDGEEWALTQSRDAEVIKAALASSDSDRLAFQNPDGSRVGWALLIWGNDADLISDNTDNAATNALLEGAEKLAEAFQ